MASPLAELTDIHRGPAAALDRTPQVQRWPRLFRKKENPAKKGKQGKGKGRLGRKRGGGKVVRRNGVLPCEKAWLTAGVLGGGRGKKVREHKAERNLRE